MTLIIALGGTIKPSSTTQSALNVAVNAAKARGAEVRLFDGPYLARLPHYGLQTAGEGAELVEAVRAADGVIIASPGYHASPSGLVKNALDYLEDLAKDRRPYLDGRAVGLIVTAYGPQATMGSIVTLRTIVHSLRGWPTPFAATVQAAQGLFAPDGTCTDDKVRSQLELIGEQTVAGARTLKAIA